MNQREKISLFETIFALVRFFSSLDIVTVQRDNHGRGRSGSGSVSKTDCTIAVNWFDSPFESD